MCLVWGRQEGFYQIYCYFPAKGRVKSTSARVFSFSSHCVGRTSELARLTFVEVPLEANGHEFIGNSLYYRGLSPTVLGCLGAGKEKRNPWIHPRLELFPNPCDENTGSKGV